MAAHEYRNYIPFMFYRFLNEVFVPLQVGNDSVLLPGGEAGRENEDLLFRFVGCIDLVD